MFRTILILSLNSVILLNSCSSTSTISNVTEQLVNTNGIYLAINNNGYIYTKTGDSLKSVQGIKIIRFLSQNRGIIIQDNIDSDAEFTKDRIKKLYDWCMEFEKRNPDYKPYIYFKPVYSNDEIRFTQSFPEAKYIYNGINYKDSILLAYKTFNPSWGDSINAHVKYLNFKFYELE